VLDGTWKDIYEKAGSFKHAKVEVSEWSKAKEISYQMIKWWKGVLLPALEKDTGDTQAKWECRLKLNVDPDYFKPYVVEVQGMAVTILPSIASMPMKRACQLIDGSVEWLQDNGFTWVTGPDPELRKL
jgi:hypothetical protein